MSKAAITGAGAIPREELTTLISVCPPFKAKMDALTAAISAKAPEADQERLWADAILIAEGWRHGVEYARQGLK